MRGAAHEVGEDTERKRGDQGRGTAGDQHGEEGGVHRADVRRAGGEHVVRVEVQAHDDEERGLPRQAGGADNLHHRSGEPGDQAVLVQVRRHGDEGGEPGQGIPSGPFGEALLPGDDAGDEQGGQADERGGDRADADFGAEDPQTDGHHERGGHDLFVTRHGAELGELFLGLFRGFGGVLHLGGVQHVQDQGHADEAHQAGEGRGERPLAPGDGLADRSRGEVHGQRVRRHRGDEHAGRHGRGLEHGHHDVRAHLLLRALVRLGAARHAQGFGEGKEDTARSRGEGGNSRREERFGEHQGVRQAERGFAEDGHDHVRDAVPEAGFDETAREEKRKRDEPRDLRRKRAERGAEGKQTGDHGDAEADQSRGTQGKRLFQVGRETGVSTGCMKQSDISTVVLSHWG